MTSLEPNVHVQTATGQLTGAKFWVDFFALQKEPLTIFSRDNVVVPLGVIPKSSRGEIFQLLEDLGSDADQDLPNWINSVLNHIDETDEKKGLNSAKNLTVLFAGFELMPESEQRLLFVRRGGEITLIDFSFNGGNENVSHLATGSGGEFRRILIEQENNSDAFRLQNEMILTALSKLGQHLIVGTKTNLLASGKEIIEIPDDAVGDRELANRKEREIELALGVEAFEMEVMIEDGVESSSFIMSKATTEGVKFEIISPSGKQIEINETNSFGGQGERYQLIRILNPELGKWKLRAQRLQRGEEAKVKLIAAVSRPNFLANLDVSPIEPGKIGLTGYINIDDEMIVGIENPIVHIRSLSPAENFEKWVELVLERYIPSEDSGWVEFESEGYRAKVDLPALGWFEFTVRFANAGTARRARSNQFQNNMAKEQTEPIPPFARSVTKRFFVR